MNEVHDTNEGNIDYSSQTEPVSEPLMNAVRGVTLKQVLFVLRGYFELPGSLLADSVDHFFASGRNDHFNINRYDYACHEAGHLFVVAFLEYVPLHSVEVSKFARTINSLGGQIGRINLVSKEVERSRAERLKNEKDDGSEEVDLLEAGFADRISEIEVVERLIVCLSGCAA